MRKQKIMKTIFSILASTLLAVSGFAQYREQQTGQRQYGQRQNRQQQYGQTVTINFADNGYGNNVYQVSIDGRNYSSGSSNNNGSYNKNANYNSPDIVLNNIQAGQHTIQVYRLRNSNYGNNNASPLYSSTFILRQGFDATLSVRKNGQVQFSERQSGAYNNNSGRKNNDRDRDGDRDDRGNGGYNNGNNNNGYPNNGGYNNGYGNGQYRAPMADYQFSQILQGVKGKWFQPSKVTAIKDQFSNTSVYFSTSQISQLLQLITTESSRLELAELSYRVVADPQNFSQLYNLFSSQSSRDELDRYIRGNRY